ncbi:MAG: AAA family ATPase [Nitrososphaerales archaeon]|nr:AAA family ATPase [Nitrososphaerales archaeon]
MKISNFRSVKSQTVSVAPITVFYGPNSTGKSSFLYAMAVFRNIALNPNQQPLGFFNVGFANLGDFERVVHDHKQRNFISFEIESEQSEVKLRYEASIRGTEGKFRLTADGALKLALEVPCTFPYPLNGRDQKDIEYDGKTLNVSWNGVTATVTPKDQSPESVQTATTVNELLNRPIEELRRTEFVPLKRGFSKPNYNPVPLTPLLLGEDEVATYLANNMFLQGKVSTFLEKILDREFRVHVIPGTASFSMFTIEKPGGTTVDVINDGFGVNQVIWLLAKSLRDDVDLVCLEEPEIHLHPSAVRKLAQGIAELAKKGTKRFIITTHSEVLLTAILGMVSQNRLRPEDISCYLTSKDEVETRLERQKIEADGQVEGGLRSFVEAELEDVTAFLSPKDNR